MKFPSKEKGVYFYSPRQRMVHRILLFVCVLNIVWAHANSDTFWVIGFSIMGAFMAFCMLYDAADQKKKDLNPTTPDKEE